MNKFYVPEDVAEKLRAKGYYREYDVTDEWVEGIFYQVEDGTFHHPRLDEVLDWLREEKKMNVNMRLLVENGWYFSIQDYMGVQRYSILQDAKDTDDLYSSYEEAAIAGIEYVLDNLI